MIMEENKRGFIYIGKSFNGMDTISVLSDLFK
jgi:hypothetical protein